MGGRVKTVVTGGGRVVLVVVVVVVVVGVVMVVVTALVVAVVPAVGLVALGAEWAVVRGGAPSRTIWIIPRPGRGSRGEAGRPAG